MTKKEFVVWLKKNTVIDTSDKKLVGRIWLGIMARQLNHMSTERFDKYVGDRVRAGEDLKITLY